MKFNIKYCILQISNYRVVKGLDQMENFLYGYQVLGGKRHLPLPPESDTMNRSVEQYITLLF